MPCGGKGCLALLQLLFISEAFSFLGDGNSLIIGLLLLISEINEENANSGLCAFGDTGAATLLHAYMKFHHNTSNENKHYNKER